MYEKYKLMNIKTILSIYGNKLIDEELTDISIILNKAKLRVDKEEESNG